MKPTNNNLLDTAIELCENDEMCGICHSCGYIQDCCEPDARNYTCEDCGENKVFGAQETLIMLG
jgi:hypothetical protein